MRVLLLRASTRALDLLFPSHCFGCGKDGTFICSSCEPSLPRLEPPYCHICAQPGATGRFCGQCSATPLALEGIRAPYLMVGTIQEAIYALKYRNVRAAAPALSHLIARWMESTTVPGEALVPVPLYRRRLRSRGYNQSALLARELSRRTGLPVVDNMLVRTRDSPPQVSLASREERARNVEGSFECAGDAHGRNLILVDDVVTTGSTISACARALKAGGASSVWGLSLARTADYPPKNWP